jgi:hypothetical protein
MAHREALKRQFAIADREIDQCLSFDQSDFYCCALQNIPVSTALF